MILFCSDGLQSKELAQHLGVHEHTVGKWRRRFVKDRIEGLTDQYRAGCPRRVSAEGAVSRMRTALRFAECALPRTFFRP